MYKVIYLTSFFLFLFLALAVTKKIFLGPNIINSKHKQDFQNDFAKDLFLAATEEV